MKTISYAIEFAEKVRDGSKRQTIRKSRKTPFVVGDELKHTCSQCAPGSKTLRTSTCTNARDIIIAKVDGIYIDGVCLTHAQSHTLAVADGFRGITHMVDWLKERGGLPFEGQVLSW